MLDDEPFASPADLASRWRVLSDSEIVRANALIDDASSLIRDLCTDWNEKPEASLRRVTCAMVRRAMTSPAGDDISGVSQQSMTSGPYTQQWTFSNPTGDLYLTKAERQSLGIGRQKAFEVDLLAQVVS